MSTWSTLYTSLVYYILPKIAQSPKYSRNGHVCTLNLLSCYGK